MTSRDSQFVRRLLKELNDLACCRRAAKHDQVVGEADIPELEKRIVHPA
jgi:hypothetical protein